MADIQAQDDKSATRTPKPADANAKPAAEQHNLTGVRVLKVSAQSNPKSVAGSIAHITRSGEPPVVTAVGPSSSNQAVKALSIARKYLENDKIDVGFKPVFRRDQEINRSLVMTVVRREAATDDKPVSDVKIRRDSEPNKTAGAIAGKIREGSSVTLSCITFGAESVYCAVEAIAMARQYLQDDKLDLTAYPEFVQVSVKDGNRSALRFDLRVSRV